MEQCQNPGAAADQTTEVTVETSESHCFSERVLRPRDDEWSLRTTSMHHLQLANTRMNGVRQVLCIKVVDTRSREINIKKLRY